MLPSLTLNPSEKTAQTARQKVRPNFEKISLIFEKFGLIFWRAVVATVMAEIDGKLVSPVFSDAQCHHVCISSIKRPWPAGRITAMISQILFLSVQVIHKPAKKRLCETIRLCEMMLYGNIFPILFFSWFIVFYQLSISNQIKQYTQGSVVFFSFLPSAQWRPQSEQFVQSHSHCIQTGVGTLMSTV